ncbi:hypothetical protein BKA56DRAFT_577242 [Ilyonectria sp. MPI-CAGE-AT-0026]|nr:hypothetical protein BKA56DRAFT_577242 [Ilyonectria sp. MPI-CAGE-AT-0026]
MTSTRCSPIGSQGLSATHRHAPPPPPYFSSMLLLHATTPSFRQLTHTHKHTQH